MDEYIYISRSRSFNVEILYVKKDGIKSAKWSHIKKMDISSILQAIQNNSASSMFSIESISDFILFSKEFVYDIAH